MRTVTNEVVLVELAPALRGETGVRDLICPEGTIYCVISCIGLTPGRLFYVQGPGYKFECRLSDHSLDLVRNDKMVSVALADQSGRTGEFVAVILWAPERLLVSINNQRESTCNTPPCFPPYALLEWARRKTLAPVTLYDSGEMLFQAVVDQLMHLRDKIIDSNGIQGFWDIEYDGNKILSRKPKHETDIHPQIRLQLYDLEIQKGLQVIPECQIGTGRLDFLISGRTLANNVINVCVEFKRSHASDLAHGLQKQLPEYMTRKATDYGIFCVLDFGADYPTDTSKFHVAEHFPHDSSLEMLLPLEASHIGRRFLKTLIFDVSRRPAPSKQ